MIRTRIFLPRYCTVCQSVRVFGTDVLCSGCEPLWGPRIEEPWFQELIKWEEAQYRSLRNTRRKERPLHLAK